MTPLRTTIGLCAVALILASAASAATPSNTAFLSFKGMAADTVGFGHITGPDGQADGHFTLTLTNQIASTVTSIELWCGSEISDTDPKTYTSSLALIQNGKRLNPGDAAINLSVAAGTFVYDLYSGDPGYFKGGSAGTCFSIVRFVGGSAVIGKSGPAPAASTPTTPAPAPLPTTTTTRPRLEGKFPVKLTVVRTNARARSEGTNVGDVSDSTWTFLPQCTKGLCDVILRVSDGSTSMKVKLRYNGTAYVGSGSTPLPGECNGKSFLFGDGQTGQLAWTAKITAAKFMAGQLRSTAISGTQYISLVPTDAFKAAGCTRTSNTRQTLEGTRR